MTTRETVLEVRDLTKYFPLGSWLRPRYLRALEGVSFAIARGEVVALVGESGSGKSTAARLIARLIEPTRGEILLHGRDVLKAEPKGASLSYRKAVQMIFQDPFASLNPVRTVFEHLELPLRIHGIARGREAQQRVYELLATVGLNPPHDIAGRYPHELSGGMRQRVAIARALAVEPEIILADEPTSMLDVSIRMGVLNLLDDLKRERGIGYLYITHDLASARYFADRTIVLYAGHVVEGADSVRLMDSPAHPYTQLLISAVPDPAVPRRQGAAQSAEVRQAAPVQEEPVSLFQGERAAPAAAPTGCPFAARCPRVMDVCRSVMPGRTYLESSHWVRCHLYGAGEGETPGEPDLQKILGLQNNLEAGA